MIQNKIHLDGHIFKITDLFMYEAYNGTKGYFKSIYIKTHINGKVYNYELTAYDSKLPLLDDVVLYNAIEVDAEVLGRFKKMKGKLYIFNRIFHTIAIIDLKVTDKISKAKFDKLYYDTDNTLQSAQ